MSRLLFSIIPLLFSITVFAQIEPEVTGPTPVDAAQEAIYAYNSEFLLRKANWEVTGGVILDNGFSSMLANRYWVQVRWNAVNSGSVTLKNGTLLLSTLSIVVNGPPSNPPNPTASSNTCGNKTLTRQGTPPKGIKWYWQNSSSATSTSIGYGATRSVSSSGTYYIRARNSSGQWSTGSGSVSVTVNQPPSGPPVPSVVYNCGTATLTRSNPPSGTTYYWQTSSNGTSTANSGLTYEATSNATYYLRAKKSGCWSSSTEVIVFMGVPGTTLIAGSATSTETVPKVYTYDEGTNPVNGAQWTAVNGLVSNIKKIGTVHKVTVTWSSAGTGVLNLCNGDGKIVRSKSNVTILPRPATPSAPILSSNSCGDKTLSFNGAPPNNVRWYWQSSPNGTSGSLGYANSIVVDASDTYYLRAKNNIDAGWSTNSTSVDVIVNQPPSGPPAPSVVYNCGTATLTRSNPPSGTTYYWQTSSNGTSTANSGLTYKATSNATYYLRAKKSGCWSSSTEVIVFMGVPGTTLIAGSATSTETVPKVYTYDEGTNPVNGAQWTAVNGLVSNIKKIGTVHKVTVTWSSAGTGVLNLCNGDGKIVRSKSNVTILPRPTTPPTPSVSTNTCGDKTISFNDPPPNDVRWYWQSSANGTSTSLGFASSKVVDTSGNYYLRAKNDIDEGWSINTASVNVVVNAILTAPIAPVPNYSCGNATINKPATNGNTHYYWQVNESAKSIDDEESVKTFTENTILYLRAYNGTCWSDVTEIYVSPIGLMNEFAFNGPQSSTTGTTGYYTFDSGATLANPQWSVSKGLIVDENEQGTEYRIWVNWDQPTDLGQVTMCNNGKVIGRKTVKVKPKTPFIIANDCGEATINHNNMSSPVTKYYWQTAANGESFNLGYESQLTTTVSDTYFIRYYDNMTGWGPVSVGVGVSVNPKPSKPTGGSGDSSIGVGTVHLSVADNGLVNQWYLNGELVNEGDDFEITLAKTTTFKVYSNDNGCQSASYISVTGNIVALPYIESSNGTFLSVGQSTSLSVNDAYNSYQWLKDAQDIEGANQVSLVISEPGQYAVRVGLDEEESYLSNLIKIQTLSNIPDDTDQATVINNSPVSNVDNGSINYVRTFVPRVPITGQPAGSMPTEQDNDYLLNDNLVTTSTQYIDGLGRPVQTVIKKGSRNQNDIVQPISYDNSGRPSKDYLLYSSDQSSGAYENDVLYDQYQFYHDMDNNSTSSRAYKVARTGVPYTEKVYESSPLNKVVAQASSGESWNKGKGKKIKFDIRPFDFGLDPIVRNWSVSNDQLAELLTFNQGTLMVSITIDENGNESRTYSNKQGQQILKRVGTKNQNEWLETYYVYDIYGDLRYVLPPECSSNLPEGFSFANHAYILNDWAFQYKYDGRNRMIEKKVPGAKRVLMVYDQYNRLVLTQDGEQRKNGKNEWVFTKYDNLNRPVLTGVYDYGAMMENQIRTAINNNTSEARGSVVHGYTNNALPSVVDPEGYLTVTYYDDYIFDHASSMSFAPYQGFDQERNQNILGNVTGTKTKLLDESGWITSINYYDDKYRLIQSQTQVPDFDLKLVTNAYNFVGELVKTRTDFDGKGIINEYFYDHMGRMLQVDQKILENENIASDIVLLKNEYNEIGELIDKKLYSEDNGNSFSQSVDYTYNSRGWLTSINDLALTDTSDDVDDYFGMELSYDHGFEKKQYNGNISGVKWKSFGDKQSKAYGYVYDGLNRLRYSDYVEDNSGIWNQKAGAYNVHIVDYDGNGNILGLERFADHSGNAQIDNLSYKYTNGNQLSRVNEAAPTAFKDEGFKNGANSNSEYLYDANGNMTQDLNKEITGISYNYLNLPEKVEKADGQYIKYIYDAGGAKLAQEVHAINGDLIKRTDYIGEFIYESEGANPAELALIQHEEGRIVPGLSGDWEYQYFLRDHLGNNRVVFTTKPKTHEFTLNYESDTNLPDDEALFEELNNIIPANIHDHTDAGSTYNKSQLLNGANGGVIGSVVTIPVGAGDKVSAEVWAKYLAPTGTSNPTAAVGSLLIAALTGNTGINNYEGSITSSYGTSGSMATGVFGDEVSSTEPMAFINLLFLPDDVAGTIENSHFAFSQISSASSNSHAILALDEPYEAPESGYIVVYLSNESTNLTEVYFDDLKVTVNEHPVIQTNSYYPFGLEHAGGFNRVTSPKNNYKFNGVEQVQDLGFDMYTTLFRLYDPAIGRFHQIDPLAEFMPGINPYNFGFDNPISFADPDGLAPMWWIKLKAQVNKIGKRLSGDKTSPGVASGRHKGNMVTVTTGNHNLKPYQRAPQPESPNPVAGGDTPNKVKPKGFDFSMGEPDNNITMNPVEIPEPKQPVLRTGQGDIPVDARTRVRMNFSPFGGNSSVVNNTGQLNNFLNPIADFLRDNPAMAVTIVVNTQLPQAQLNQIININGGTNNATTRQLLSQRGQAIQRALLNLGTDPRQVVFMFNNGANTNRVDLRFRNR